MNIDKFITYNDFILDMLKYYIPTKYQDDLIIK